MGNVTKILGKVLAVAGNTATKKAGMGTAIYGAINLDPITTGVGLAIRFHDKVDALVAKARDIVAGAAILKGMVDDANAQAKTTETEKQA